MGLVVALVVMLGDITNNLIGLVNIEIASGAFTCIVSYNWIYLAAHTYHIPSSLFASCYLLKYRLNCSTPYLVWAFFCL